VAEDTGKLEVNCRRVRDNNTSDTAYDRHAAVLNVVPQQACHDEAAARRLHRWLREERLAWLEVTGLDPFLPERLHPPGYRGMKGWHRRLEIMAEAGRQLRSFIAIP
jgi:hypothetical protein